MSISADSSPHWYEREGGVAASASASASVMGYTNAWASPSKSAAAAALPEKRAKLDPIPQHLIDSISSGNCVAFVGAGFSIPANLPSWSELLNGIIDDVECNVSKPGVYGSDIDQELIDFLRKTTKKASDQGNSDLYDLVGQILEDKIGARKVEEMVEEKLKIKDDDIPEEMRSRIQLLNSIPFKAILTTNFDMLMQGPTPWDQDPQSIPYAKVLRKTDHQGNADLLNFSIDELTKEHMLSDEKTRCCYLLYCTLLCCTLQYTVLY